MIITTGNTCVLPSMMFVGITARLPDKITDLADGREHEPYAENVEHVTCGSRTESRSVLADYPLTLGRNAMCHNRGLLVTAATSS